MIDLIYADGESHAFVTLVYPIISLSALVLPSRSS